MTDLAPRCGPRWRASRRWAVATTWSVAMLAGAIACGPRLAPRDATPGDATPGDATPSAGPSAAHDAMLIEAHLDPGPLLPYLALPAGTFWRQRVTATWVDGEQGFDAVLQASDTAVSLVGLSPMGQPAFVVRHDANGVSFENFSDRELPFPPSFMIADVQKVFYPWLTQPVPAGRFAGPMLGYAVAEHWEEGMMTSRTITREFDEGPRVATVVCEGWLPELAVAEVCVLENGWYGYELRVVTVAQ